MSNFSDVVSLFSIFVATLTRSVTHVATVCLAGLSFPHAKPGQKFTLSSTIPYLLTNFLLCSTRGGRVEV